MDYKVSIDWKFVVALGVPVIGIICVVKMNPEQVKEVLINAVDAYKDYAVAVKCDR